MLAFITSTDMPLISKPLQLISSGFSQSLLIHNSRNPDIFDLIYMTQQLTWTCAGIVLKSWEDCIPGIVGYCWVT